MRFSTSFLHVLVLSAVTLAAASCAYIIPPETNPPRDNELMGERRKPQLNGAISPQSNLPPRVMPQQPTEAQLTGIDTAPPAALAATAPVMAPVVVAPTVASAASDRRVPVENMQFQMAANDTYPPITSVPPRPVMSGPDSAYERLNETKSTLEQDRANAAASKAQLTQDAAEEPSMLSDLPPTDGVIAPNDPIRAVPVINPSPAAAPSVMVPAPNDIRPRAVPSSSLPWTDKPVAITPVKTVTAAASPRVIAPPPPSAIAYEPPVEEPRFIRAPVAAAPAPIVAAPVEIARAPVAAPAPVQPLPPAPISMKPQAPQVKKGDFDPLAVADNAPITTQAAKASRGAATYASSAYIAPSRYAERRY